MPISSVALQPSAAPPSLDLTGKARIRHAALQLFASKGYAQASLRRIAQRANVSLALIGHHFGSKLLLREAVDQWIVRRLGEAALSSIDLRAPLAEAAAQLARGYQAGLDVEPDMRAYLRRTVLEDVRGEALVLSLSLEQIRQILGQVSDVMRAGSPDPLLPWSAQVFVQVFGQLVLEPALRRDAAGLTGGAAPQLPFAASPGLRHPGRGEAAVALGLVHSR
ncbi:MAG TPA: helix-turn-helix domain-containing protein [Dokdonella sp.]|uniref:TetR/AcrR family transcriptional regulator n=1 Tax=Dokdonella sp. TaxID=2291710 RepID=UPI002C2DBC95|nr:helix-turn-helix domain-containing protein [Dokdonella sp.]HUD40374.1 helix-turn-helix domain-containing protein [Dokdonella sp.]